MCFLCVISLSAIRRERLDGNERREEDKLKCSHEAPLAADHLLGFPESTPFEPLGSLKCCSES